jgi:hypothetical protein
MTKKKILRIPKMQKIQNQKTLKRGFIKFKYMYKYTYNYKYNSCL